MLRNMKRKLSVNAFLLSFAAVFIVVGGFLQWQLFLHNTQAVHERLADYQRALEAYEQNNVYYDPDATITWLRNRKNPAGYFVPNPDLIFEPSQLNASTLRATRYAVVTLQDLEALDQIDRKAVLEFVLSNYIPDLEQTDVAIDRSVYTEGPYAAFRTIKGEPLAVRPTMDALMMLEALGALDDPRVDLERIQRFILAHHNPDGGFWDEHYFAEHGKSSCIKCTSFAVRALAVIQRHFKRAFEDRLRTKTSSYIKACFDVATGGYADQPGKRASDSYDTFRAFITLWWLGGLEDSQARAFVEANMDVSRTIDYIYRYHYLPEVGAFSRYIDSATEQPSLKATHLLIWFMKAMGREERLDVPAIARYVASRQSSPGEYGGDIYSTYSATGIFRKLGIRTEPLPEPQKPPAQTSSYPVFVPYMFFVLSLVTLALSYLSKKSELETLNRMLAQQASVDGLTGIYNRKKFEELLALEREQSTRYETPLSLILFDVDEFKRINDALGHVVGDTVLQRLATIVADNTRESDICARWGGEEFVILAPGIPLSSANKLAEKLRFIIEESNFGEAGKITCSFGVTQFHPGENAESLLGRADTMMYRAKQAGRNRAYAA